MNPIEPFLHVPRIAYFSMEIALRSDVPTYSGGLGVLAGDTLRTSADLQLPLIGITLASRQGYFNQVLDPQGRQSEQPAPWDPAQWAKPLAAKIAVSVEGRQVWVRSWLFVMEGGTGYQIPVILLDTDLPENNSHDREITSYLYGGDEVYRLKQEVVLGIGGVRMLRALGLDIPTYHMNEGHSALLALDLLARFERPDPDTGGSYEVQKVRDLCLFTTHTPVEAGHDQFSYDLVRRVLDDFIDIETLKTLGGAERLNMTRLALSLSGYVNGVAKSHALTSSTMFPGYHVHAVTNGVHPRTWTCSSMAKLYDTYWPEWRHEPELLVRADQLPAEALRVAHAQAKASLIDHVKNTTGVVLDPAQPILGFARRMTAYKRPDLLFSDITALKAIAHQRPFQIVLAGKAHPRDEPGKRLIAHLHECIGELRGAVNAAYLPNYDMSVGLLMVAGSDVWVNTPLRPLEASGTSGMKAALNGVPNFSVLDGWWVEGCIEGVTGWSIGASSAPDANGDDAVSLYDKLRHVVLPLYYDDQPGWTRVMQGAISKNAYYFNSHRMMRRYATEAYIR